MKTAMHLQRAARTAIAAAALMGLAVPASAEVCTLAAGEECILNWDVSSYGPGPWTVVSIGLLSQDDATVEYFWYDGLDATGALVASGGPITGFGPSEFPILIDSMWDDGRGSLRLVNISGFTFFGATAPLGFIDDLGNEINVLATPGATVPTPGTLALVAAAGLAAVWPLRRKRRAA